MRIISKEKDYYDYLTGIYGIDNYVVFDRRNYSFFNSDIYNLNCRYRNWMLIHFTYNNEILFVLEIGNVQYLFHADNEHIILVKKFDSNNQIFELQKNKWTKEELYSNYDAFYNFNTIDKAMNNLEVINVYLIDTIVLEHYRNKKNKNYLNDITFDNIVNNATLYQSGVFMPKNLCGLISAEETYNNIYNFLLSKKECRYNDNMTDVEKLVSKGFDKRTSFRKM